MILVTGGSASGKSAFAEQLLAGQRGLHIYLATMRDDSEEGKRRVQKHRAHRRDRGFYTVEAPRDLMSAFSFLPFTGQKAAVCREADKAGFPCAALRDSAVLLECLSNLAANEMFLENGSVRDAEQCREMVLREVFALRDACRELIVVGAILSEAHCHFDARTNAWIKSFSEIQNAVAEAADAVWKVEAGIPACLK